MEIDLVQNGIKTTPFLRYVGGKRWFVRKEFERLPTSVINYYEPFLGSGAIFFSLKNSNRISGESFLSDINEDLVECYIQIRDNFDNLCELLSNFENTRAEFYKIREKVPNRPIERAARFLYLNRTCFGGIYRENRNGSYNVPYGNRSYKELFNYENLKLVNQKLASTSINTSCFSKITIDKLTKADFFCLDPPYLGSEDKFNRYHRNGFNSLMLEELIDLIEIISSKSRFLLFIGNDMNFAKQIEHLGERSTLTRSSNLSRSKNMSKSEMVIKNY